MLTDQLFKTIKKKEKGISTKIMNLQLCQLSTQCLSKFNQPPFNSLLVEKASLKKKKINSLQNSDPKGISPTRWTWFSLPVPWDQSSQGHLSRSSLIPETEGGKKDGGKILFKFNLLQLLFTTSEFYIVISDSWLNLENEAMRSLAVSVYMFMCALSFFLPLGKWALLNWIKGN